MALPTRVHQRGFVDPLEVIGREFDSALGRFFSGDMPGDGGQRRAIMAPFGVDIREDQDHLYIEADVPGFKKDEVDITLENNTLTITAEHKDQGEQKQGDWLLNERRYTRFQRSFTLPPTIDEQSVDARLDDGVLKVTLNKKQEAKPRKIQVA
jgi:HSP20 family protein